MFALEAIESGSTDATPLTYNDEGKLYHKDFIKRLVLEAACLLAGHGRSVPTLFGKFCEHDHVLAHRSRFFSDWMNAHARPWPSVIIDPQASTPSTESPALIS